MNRFARSFINAGLIPRLAMLAGLALVAYYALWIAAIAFSPD